ncbi:MmcQ/YjbR family DNA-binding protein [Spirillospora sp. CA-294931]|uniref:MmcQ/YjbR family DNA-binding protein n=1 Tax=Spirillospora sp. CA-294931 TaxID=3240042 RepID=UPI003D938710
MSDPDTARDFALSLPGTEERISWGMPTFRLRKGMFAALPDSERPHLAFRFPMEERPAMLLAEPDKFFIREGHDPKYNWLRVHLDAIDDEELRAILVDSWRQVAPKKLQAEYDK